MLIAWVESLNAEKLAATSTPKGVGQVNKPAQVGKFDLGDDIFLIPLSEHAVDQVIVQQDTHPEKCEENECENSLEGAEKCTHISNELK